MAGPIVSFLHWCSRVSSISRIFGREPSLVSPSVRLLHTENEATLEDTHATDWATGRSLMTNPRSAWRELSSISTPYEIGRSFSDRFSSGGFGEVSANAGEPGKEQLARPGRAKIGSLLGSSRTVCGRLDSPSAGGLSSVCASRTPSAAGGSVARSGEVSCAEAGTHGAARASQADAAVPVSFGIRLVMASPVAFHLAGLGGRV